MQCPRCKAEIEKGEKYCSSCGWKVKSGKKKRIIITTAVVLAVALIAGGVFYLFFGGGLFSSDNVSTLSEEQINELSNENFVMLEEGFTDVAVKDEESAIKAVASVAGKLGIENAEKELKVSAVNTVDGDTYYRMQQFYNDIPVYGKDVVLASNKKGSVILLTSNSINIEQGLNGKSIDNDFDDKKAVATLEDYFDDLYSIEDKGPYYMVLDNNSIEYTHLYTVLAAVNEEAANLEVAVSNNKYKVVFTNDLVNTDDKDYSYKVSDNKYYMFDEKRNIVMLNSKRNLSKILGNDSEKHIFNSKPLIIDGFSDKEQTYVFLNYLNNNNDEIINDISGKFSTHVYSPIEYEMSKNDKWNKDAVNFMNNVQNTYDFYKDILHRNGYNDKQGEMFVAYNDGFDGGGNAYSSGSFLCFGYKEDSSAVDLVAHEFTHSVEGSITNMVREGESGALKEAYSDIFGELAESYTNGSCDWIHGKGRNLKDPSKSKESGSTVAYPQKYKDKNWISTINKNKDHGGVHTNCTVISHAAYLMNNGIDGDENMKIGTELLAKIWYKSLQPLHPNATFEQCAATVTSAAKIMYKNGTLTQSQLGCVEEAFAEVGLGTSLIESGSSLVIYDRYQKKYDNYHITIKDAFEGKTVVDTDIKGTDTYTLDLESGTYKITVSDNTKDGSKNTFSKTISVVNSLRKIKSEVSLYTDFGVDYDAMLEQKQTETEPTTSKPPQKETKPVSYDSYLGWWVSTGNNGASMGVQFKSFSENNATFIVEKISANAAHIACTNEITAEIVNGKTISFNFTDTFSNSGTGTITLNGDTIHLYVDITDLSNQGFGVYGECDLYKSNDNTQVDVNSDEWKDVYIDYLNNNGLDEFGSFNLVYVDDDDIPEVILYGSFNVVASKLLWIDSSDTLHEEIIGGRTDQLTYKERQGKIMHSDFLLGEKNKNHSSVVVYSLDNDNFSTVFSGSIIGEYNFTSISDLYKNNENTCVSSYSVNNSEVSEKDFFKSLTGVYDIYSSDCKGVYNEDTSSNNKNDFIVKIEKY